jgi:hypothetical protein
MCKTRVDVLSNRNSKSRVDAPGTSVTIPTGWCLTGGTCVRLDLMLLAIEAVSPELMLLAPVNWCS